MIHPRVKPVRVAMYELESWLPAWRHKHSITPAEELTCLMQVIEDSTKSALQRERHPNDPSMSPHLADGRSAIDLSAMDTVEIARLVGEIGGSETGQACTAELARRRRELGPGVPGTPTANDLFGDPQS